MADTPKERIVVREWSVGTDGKPRLLGGPKPRLSGGAAVIEHNAVISELRAALARETTLWAAYEGTGERLEAAEANVARLRGALKGLLDIHDWMIEAGGCERPLPQDVITKFAEMQIPAIEAAREALAPKEPTNG